MFGSLAVANQEINQQNRASPKENTEASKGFEMKNEDKTEQNAWMELQGRFLAMEAMMSHLIWRWALDKEHPPTALATYLRPLEEKAAAMAADPANDAVAMKAAQNTIRGIAESLEHALHEEALRRATQKDQALS